MAQTLNLALTLASPLLPPVDSPDTGPKACLRGGQHRAADGVGDGLHGLPAADGAARNVHVDRPVQRRLRLGTHRSALSVG